MSKNILDAHDVKGMLKILGLEHTQFEQEKPICFHLNIPDDFRGDAFKKICKDIQDKKIENEKPFVDYSKEYPIWELETLLKNMPEDTRVSFGECDYKLKYFEDGEYDFVRDSGYTLSETNTVSEILKARFKLVQPKPTGKWVDATKSQLLQAIFDGKTIGFGGKPIMHPVVQANFSQKAEYICDNYPEAFNNNQIQIWEEIK